jgi:Tfp pilus assembly protein PilN
MRAQVDPQEIALMSDAAREANDVIELRAFSWGTLLTQLERTLPDDVRVTSIRPRVEERTIVLQLDVESQSDEALSAFMDGLERTGSFRNMLPTRRQWADDDVIDAVIEGIYSPNAPVSEATAERRGSEARP